MTESDEMGAEDMIRYTADDRSEVKTSAGADVPALRLWRTGRRSQAMPTLEVRAARHWTVAGNELCERGLTSK